MSRKLIYFSELFAPTVAISSVRLLTAMACELDLDLCHFHVEQAFVQSDLEEYMHMRLPQGSLIGRQLSTAGPQNLGETCSAGG